MSSLHFDIQKGDRYEVGVTSNNYWLEDCMTLWGEPKRVHMQNVEQLNAHDCHQNVIEYSTTSLHQKKTHMHKQELWVELAEEV